MESESDDAYGEIKTCAEMSMTQRSLQIFAYGLRVQRNESKFGSPINLLEFDSLITLPWLWAGAFNWRDL